MPQARADEALEGTERIAVSFGLALVVLLFWELAEMRHLFWKDESGETHSYVITKNTGGVANSPITGGKLIPNSRGWQFKGNNTKNVILEIFKTSVVRSSPTEYRFSKYSLGS